MTLNGQTAPAETEESLVFAVARVAYDADFQDGDPLFDELSPEQRAALIGYAEVHLAAFRGWLDAHGWRLVPPGMLLKPTTETEAMAMVAAAKEFLDGHKRKGRLMGGAVERPKLIVPGRAH